jgi:hypothetical protein
MDPLPVLRFPVAAAVLHLLEAVEFAHALLTERIEGFVVKIAIVEFFVKGSVVGFALSEVFTVEADALQLIEPLHQFVEASKKLLRTGPRVPEHPEKVFADLLEMGDVLLALILFDLFGGIAHATSILDLDRSPDGHMLPEVVEIFVGHGDAAVGPVMTQGIGVAMAIPIPVGLAVDGDEIAGLDPQFLGPFLVLLVGIAEIEGPVFDRMAALSDDLVLAGRGPEIPLLDLGALGSVLAQGDRHGFDHFAVVVEVHFVSRLPDQDTVDPDPFEFTASRFAVG